MWQFQYTLVLTFDQKFQMVQYLFIVAQGNLVGPNASVFPFAFIFLPLLEMLLNLSEKCFHWWFCAISHGPTTSLARSFAISLPPIPTARSSFPTPLCPLSYSFFSPNQNRIWQPWRQWAPFTSFLSLMSRIALLQGMWFPYSAADSVRLGWDCSLVPLRASPKDYFLLLRRFSTNAWILLSLHQRSK